MPDTPAHSHPPTVFVVGRFPPPRDGATIATDRMAELLEAPYRVLRFNTEPPDRGYVAAETRFRPDRVVHAVRQRGQLARMLRNAPGAPVLWASISPTLLGHLRDVMAVAPSFGRRRPVIAVSHRATLHERFEDPRTRRTMMRLADRMAAFVFLTEGISEAVAPWIPEEKRHVIPNTIADALRNSDADVAAKQQARVAAEELDLLFLSNMMPEKGWMDVLRALPLARRLGVPFRVRFAGRWVEPADELQFKAFVLDNELEDCVTHLGGLTDPELIREHLLASDALLLPTYHPTEGLPVVILEAFASGTPVIGTHQGGLATLIRDRQNGLRVPPRDPVAIANAIARLADRDRWRLLSDGARQTFVASYDRDAVLAAWTRLIDAVASR